MARVTMRARRGAWVAAGMMTLIAGCTTGDLPVDVAAGGRTMQAYAAPGTEVVFQLGGCTVPVNTQVWFAGRLIDFP